MQPKTLLLSILLLIAFVSAQYKDYHGDLRKCHRNCDKCFQTRTRDQKRCSTFCETTPAVCSDASMSKADTNSLTRCQFRCVYEGARDDYMNGYGWDFEMAYRMIYLRYWMQEQ